MQITNISDAKASLSKKTGSGLEKIVIGAFDHLTDSGVMDTKNLCNLFQFVSIFNMSLSDDCIAFIFCPFRVWRKKIS